MSSTVLSFSPKKKGLSLGVVAFLSLVSVTDPSCTCGAGHSVNGRAQMLSIELVQAVGLLRNGRRRAADVGGLFGLCLWSVFVVPAPGETSP